MPRLSGGLNMEKRDALVGDYWRDRFVERAIMRRRQMGFKCRARSVFLVEIDQVLVLGGAADIKLQTAWLVPQ